tara:strand:- start:619 stop:1227 length:609 start_codon:yes stop_codon:yes gene_type:complete
MKLILENWRKYLTEGALPDGRALIAVNPQKYIPDWNVAGLTSDLKMYILFDPAKYNEVLQQESGDVEFDGKVAQRAMEYYYVGIQTMLGCKTEDGRQAYQTTGVTANPKNSKGFWAYHIASGQRHAALMPHRDKTTVAAANVWRQFIERGAVEISLENSCPETGLDFALDIPPWDIEPVKLSEDDIKGLLMAHLFVFRKRVK